jgi:hypothetical protein
MLGENGAFLREVFARSLEYIYHEMKVCGTYLRSV